MKKIAALILIAITILSCSKNDDENSGPPTNIGTGKTSYRGGVDLVATARINELGGYSILGKGEYRDNQVVLFFSFSKKPTTSKNYTTNDGEFYVTLEVFKGEVVDRYVLKTNEIVKVTVAGNRIEASFNDAKFDFDGTTFSSTGHVRVD